LTVGLIAAVSVALFYAVFDFLAARGTLFTVDLLGKAVFQGLRDPSVLLLPVRPDPRAILQYNVMHLLISLAIGLVVTGLVEHAERHPSRARMIALVIVGGFFVTILVVNVLTDPIRTLVPWWSVVFANALAVLLAGLYLMRRRPGIARRMLS
jgi:multisubunit Na+/H+ antiporter MnhB subunit